MKIITGTQGIWEWHQARLGKPTASRIAAVVTPSGKATTGAARRSYALELVAERITERVADHYVSAAMERGKQLEGVARTWYYLRTGAAVEQVGFCLADCGATGASPDGLVGNDGGVEIKCPLLPNYIDILSSGAIPADWLLQVHHCLYVTGRAWWDFVLYTDEQPFSGWIKRVERDADMCAKIRAAVEQFAEEVATLEEITRERMAQ